MSLVKSHTWIFQTDNGAQFAVEVWNDEAIEVMFRPTPSAVWGPPLPMAGESGDPVQFAFEEES